VNKTAMRNGFRLYRRRIGGRYYLQDKLTGKQESLLTRDRAKDAAGYSCELLAVS
jgi:hypothetical protein